MHVNCEIVSRGHDLKYLIFYNIVLKEWLDLDRNRCMLVYWSSSTLERRLLNRFLWCMVSRIPSLPLRIAATLNPPFIFSYLRQIICCNILLHVSVCHFFFFFSSADYDIFLFFGTLIYMYYHFVFLTVCFLTCT